MKFGLLFGLTALFALWVPGPGFAHDLQALPEAELLPTPWADGDSFLVRFKDPATGAAREQVFRLYAVDCMETLSDQESDRRRLLEQARHFGVENPAGLIPEGRKAWAFTQSQLAKPFTVHTVFARAPGRSGNPRFYAFVETSDGWDLATLLVKQGLARVKGVSRETPGRVPRDEYEAGLSDLELAAAIERIGVWRLCNPARLAELRAEKRREDRQLAAIHEPAEPRPGIDLNTATAEELESLPGVGETLADRILKGRPYRRPEDLLKVHGVGPATFEKLKSLIQTNGNPAGGSTVIPQTGAVGKI